MLTRAGQRGDTIIEVLLAISIFSLLSVGVMTIMNQASNNAQRALEITMVKQHIDSQAEALRAAHQGYLRLRTTEQQDTSAWKAITDTISAPIDTVECPTQAELDTSFAMDPIKGARLGAPRSMNDPIAPPFAQAKTEEVDDDGDPATPAETQVKIYGLWIESEKETAPVGGAISPPDAYNFRIRACWDGPGTSVPMRLETTVRLYDPS